jgi:hypothetical protein
MRVLISFSAAIAMSVALSMATAPTFAQGAKCVRSCTAVMKQCVSMGGHGCDADMANCMSTGNLHMPSGRTFSNLCKK